jgi:hypothetical protein
MHPTPTGHAYTALAVNNCIGEVLRRPDESRSRNVCSQSGGSSANVIASVALAEAERYRNRDECNNFTMRRRISEYWSALGIQGRNGCTADEEGDRFAWSAAFVSFIMRSAGVGEGFTYSALHADYIRSTFDGRGIYTEVYNPRRSQVAVGDLLCRHRPNRWTYSRWVRWHRDREGGVPSHCDIVVAVSGDGRITYVGGNLGDALRRRTTAQPNLWDIGLRLTG